MQIKAIKCDKCGVIHNEGSLDIFHFDGTVTKADTVIIVGGSDICSRCLIALFESKPIYRKPSDILRETIPQFLQAVPCIPIPTQPKFGEGRPLEVCSGKTCVPFSIEERN